MTNILIVDDDEPLRLVTARILANGGFDCRTAATIKEARGRRAR
jgi:DNA-binding NtrC family response regulator